MSTPKFGKPNVTAGLLPKGSFLARWKKGKYPHQTGSGNDCILADGELVSSLNGDPDYVQLADGTKMKVGGLNFRTYFILEPSKERQMADTYAAFERLSLIDENGEIDPDRVVAALNSGNIVFDVVAEGETQYHKDAANNILKDANGADRIRGYGVRTVFASDVGSRVPAFGIGLPNEHVL
jgi:hypothetical protein